jgi:hypothetical protein
MFPVQSVKSMTVFLGFRAHKKWGPFASARYFRIGVTSGNTHTQQRLSLYPLIVLQKSFWGDDQNVSGLLMRCGRRHVETSGNRPQG